MKSNVINRNIYGRYLCINYVGIENYVKMLKKNYGKIYFYK